MQNSEIRDKVQSDLLPIQELLYAGNPLSQVLFIKFELDESDNTIFFSGKDGEALKSSLLALGFDPEDFCAIGPCTDEMLTRALAALDPLVVILCDEEARCAFERQVPQSTDPNYLQEMNLDAGVLNFAHGMQILNLGGFSAHLGSEGGRQLMWKYLKQLKSDYNPY